MNKELEALEKVRNCLYPFARDNQKAFDIIETALKSYEELLKSHKDLERKYYIETLSIDYKKLKALELIEENLKYGYVFIGYDKDGKPLFQFADTKLYEEIKKNTIC